MAIKIITYPKPPETLPEHRTAKLTEINMATDATLKVLTGGYPASELLTFDKQEAEARAYLADNASPTPLLTALAAGRKISLAELASKVLAKADAFAAASGYVIGQRQGLEDLLDAAESIEDVQGIEVRLSLPDMTPPEAPETPETSVPEV